MWSAGRQRPKSDFGLYVDGLLEIGDVSKGRRRHLGSPDWPRRAATPESVFTEASTLLAGFAGRGGACLGARTCDQTPYSHVEFVGLEIGRLWS